MSLSPPTVAESGKGYPDNVLWARGLAGLPVIPGEGPFAPRLPHQAALSPQCLGDRHVLAFSEWAN